MNKAKLKPLYDHMIQRFPMGKCITFLLNNTGCPATQIAKETNTHYSYISLIINGHRVAPPSVRALIESALGFDPWDPLSPS